MPTCSRTTRRVVSCWKSSFVWSPGWKLLDDSRRNNPSWRGRGGTANETPANSLAGLQRQPDVIVPCSATERADCVTAQSRFSGNRKFAGNPPTGRLFGRTKLLGETWSHSLGWRRDLSPSNITTNFYFHPTFFKIASSHDEGDVRILASQDKCYSKPVLLQGKPYYQPINFLLPLFLRPGPKPHPPRTRG